MPSIPFTEPKIASIVECFRASRKTPTSEALIAQVGPPDCATAMFIIFFPLIFVFANSLPTAVLRCLPFLSDEVRCLAFFFFR